MTLNERNKYKTLHTIGLEVTNKRLDLRSKDQLIGVARFNEVMEVGLIKTRKKDYGSFLSILMDIFFRRFDDTNSAGPEQVYLLYVRKHNGRMFKKEIQSFNLVGARHEIRRLNKEIKEIDRQ